MQNIPSFLLPDILLLTIMVLTEFYPPKAILALILSEILLSSI